MKNRNLDLSFIFVGVVLWSVLELIFIFLGITPGAFPLFTLFLVLVVYLPGYQTLSWLKLKTSAFTHFTLAWIIGYPLSTFVYFICRYIQMEWIFGVFLAGVFFSFLFYSAREFKTPEFNWQNENYFHSLLLGLFGITLCACGWASFQNGLINQNGILQISTLNSKDFLFHYTLVNEISHFFPPHIPFAPNHLLIYHFFPDLFAALFNRWLNLNIWDLTSRFLPLLYFSSLFLSIVLLVKEISRKRGTILLGIVLVVFGSNLSFLSDLINAIKLTNAPGFLFLETFHILHINPLISALTLFFTGCFTLIKYQKSSQKSWLVITSFLFLSIAVYKIYLVVLIMGGFGIVCLVEWYKSRQLPYSLLTLIIPVILFTIFIINLSPIKTKPLEFKPGLLIESALPANGFFDYSLPGYHALTEVVQKRGGWFFVKNIVLGGIIWLLGSLGPRIIGIIFTMNFLFRSTDNWAISLMSWMCWLGIIMAMLFVTPPLNFNINQFLMVSFYIAALLTALYLDTLKSRLLIVSLVVVLAIPTGFITLARRPVNLYPPYISQVASFINKNTATDAIIATPQKNPFYGLIMTLSHKRSMYLNSYHSQSLIGVEPVLKLEHDSKLLYRSDNIELLKELIKRYNVSHIVMDKIERVRLPQRYLKTIYNDGQITISKVIALAS